MIKKYFITSLKILSIYIFMVFIYIFISHFFLNFIDIDGLIVLVAIQAGLVVLFYTEYLISFKNIKSVKGILQVAIVYFIGLIIYRIFFIESVDTGSDHYGYAGLAEVFEVAIQIGFGVVLLLYAGFRYIMIRKLKEVFKFIDKILNFSKYATVANIVLLIILIL